MNSYLKDTVDRKNDLNLKVCCNWMPKFISYQYKSIPTKKLNTETVHEEFRQFLFDCGIKPYKFNRALKEALSSAAQHQEFTDFLINYWLIVEGKANASVVESAFAVLVSKTDQIAATEEPAIKADTKALSEQCDFSTHFIMYDLLWILECSVICSGIRDFLEARDSSLQCKAAAVLGSLYAAHSTATAEEWLMYLFQFKPECKPAYDMLAVVMKAMFDIICVTIQQK